MLTRFLRTFICLLLTIIIFGSFIVIHPSTKAYLDPITGLYYGEGGSEPAPGGEGVDKESLRGGVIMGKLGKETAK
jgi:FAD-linked sulfhydryl oxidase